jgi:hypothetical protein
VRFMVIAGGHGSRGRRRCSCWEWIPNLLEMDMLTRGCKGSVGCMKWRWYLPSPKTTTSVVHSRRIVLMVGGCIRFLGLRGGL